MTRGEAGVAGDGDLARAAARHFDRPTIRPAWVMPDYAGGGIANVMPTILGLFGVESPYPPLSADVLPPDWLDGVRRVVCLIVDALGYGQLRSALAGDQTLRWHEFARRPEVALSVLTSVFPSTTTAALPTLNTGVPPAVHGGLGYTLYLPEWGAVTEMIRFGPLAGSSSFVEQGADPIAFVRAPTAFRRLAEAGVAGYTVNHAAFRGSWLSRMLGDGAAFVPANSFAELCVRVETLLDRPAAERMLVMAYYGSLDTIAHFRGAASPEHAAEFAAIDHALHRSFFAGRRRPGTLLLLLADHGQLDCPPGEAVDLCAHPDLLALAPVVAGEPRARYLHLRANAGDAGDAYLSEHFAGRVHTIDSRAALAAGWFGPGADGLPARVAVRAGDRIVLPLGDGALLHNLPESAPPLKLVGRHGGLDPREMLVPLLAARLD